MRTSLDAEANGWETMLHQALSSPSGHFVAPGLHVSSRNNVPLQTLVALESLAWR
jgi:hypothetical protein